MNCVFVVLALVSSGLAAESMEKPIFAKVTEKQI